MSPQNTDQQAEYSEALQDCMWIERCAFLSKAWVQVRYHKRRQRFFDLVDKGTKAATLVLGASLFGQQLAWLPWVATVLSSLGLMALVFGYGDRKQLHKELAEQAAGMVASIEEVTVAKLSPEIIAQWGAQHSRFCAKVPPPLKTLTLLCEREQAELDGFPDHVKMPNSLRRLFAQVKG